MIKRGDKVTLKVGRGTLEGRVMSSDKKSGTAEIKLPSGKLISRRWELLTPAAGKPTDASEE